MNTRDAYTRRVVIDDAALQQLTALLEVHALTVTLEADGTVTIANPGEEPVCRLAEAMRAEMKQRVAFHLHDGVPWAFWLWSGPERDSEPELEPMVPASDIEEIARKLAYVLSRCDEPDGNVAATSRSSP